MRKLLPLVLAAGLGAADESWVRLQAGPFEVFSGAGARPARQLLLVLEQLRFSLGQMLGKTELSTVWPIRFLVFPNAGALVREGLQAGRCKLGRVAWMCPLSPGDRLPLDTVAALLVRDNTRNLPQEVERGLVSLFSSFRVEGPYGVFPPPFSERLDRDWARVHLFCTHPDYATRARAWLSNLEARADWDAAYWNAFQLRREQAEHLVDEYLAGRQFAPRRLAVRLIDPERDFFARPLEPVERAIAIADALEGERAAERYRAVLDQFGPVAAALEGLGQFAEAVARGSDSASCYVHYGRQQEGERARQAFQKAAELNPRWATPYVELAGLESNPARKARLLERAAELDPRAVEIWVELARARFNAGQYDRAAIAWEEAERRASDPIERSRIRQQRAQLEQQREQKLAQERRREEEAILEAWEQERKRMLAALLAPETAQASGDVPQRVYQWWDERHPMREVTGKLVQIDCMRAGLRLVVETPSRTQVRVMIREPDRVIVRGKREGLQLSCGALSAPPAVRLEYVEQPDAVAGSVGEVSVLEFR